MNGADLLAEYFAATPRQSAGLSGRTGVHGQVDEILSELRIPAEVDRDGDWKLTTDVGPFLLIVDKEDSDLVAVQTMQSMERKVKNSADEMHVLLALNYAARGIARFGVVKDNDQTLLVLTARLAPEEIARDRVEAMLRDCFRLSRRVDELLGNEPPQPAAEPPESQPAEPPPPSEQAPVAAPAAETVFAQPVPQAPAAPDPPTPPPAVAEPAPPAAPDPPPPAQPEPVYPPPVVAQPEPAAPEPVQSYPPPQPPVALPVANWYPDPYYQARLRYWDGQAWTEHVAN